MSKNLPLFVPRSALLLAIGSVGAAAVVSCSSNDEPVAAPTDSGVDSAWTSDAPVLDGGAPDGPTPARDAAPFDGGPLPIVCTSPPCARSLVTTMRTSVEDDTGDRDGFCMLLDDGTVACWGANNRGQLGRGNAGAGAYGPTATRVAGLAGVVQLDHTCALDKNGAIWCWGTGPNLQSDAGAIAMAETPVQLPVPPATAIAVGSQVGCAVVDGGVLCWGSNTSGQLGATGAAPSDVAFAPTEIALPAGAPVRKLAIGFATFALREDGTTMSWGTSPPLARVSSLNPDPHPDVVDLTGISSIDLTGDVACATAGGTGYCWGVDRGEGRSPVVRPLPLPVVTPEPIVQISTAPAGHARWCAVSATGAVYCWGENSGGQAGDGTKAHAFHAVQVKGLPAPAVEVRTTPSSTCALLTNGKVHCWGTNYYGQLGNGLLKVPSLVPQEVVFP